jgi:hypothetical protein
MLSLLTFPCTALTHVMGVQPLEGECVKADGMMYHEACFRCARCNISLVECQTGTTQVC